MLRNYVIRGFSYKVRINVQMQGPLSSYQFSELHRQRVKILFGWANLNLIGKFKTFY